MSGTKRNMQDKPLHEYSDAELLAGFREVNRGERNMQQMIEGWREGAGKGSGFDRCADEASALRGRLVGLVGALERDEGNTQMADAARVAFGRCKRALIEIVGPLEGK